MMATHARPGPSARLRSPAAAAAGRQQAGGAPQTQEGLGKARTGAAEANARARTENGWPIIAALRAAAAVGIAVLASAAGSYAAAELFYSPPAAVPGHAPVAPLSGAPPACAADAQDVRAAVARIAAEALPGAEWGHGDVGPLTLGLQPKGFGTDANGTGVVFKSGGCALGELLAFHTDAVLRVCRTPPLTPVFADPDDVRQRQASLRRHASHGMSSSLVSAQVHWPHVVQLKAARKTRQFGAYRKCAPSKRYTNPRWNLCFPGGDSDQQEEPARGRCPAMLDCAHDRGLAEVGAMAAIDFVTCNADRWHKPYTCFECLGQNNVHAFAPGFQATAPEKGDAGDEQQDLLANLTLVLLDHNLAYPRGGCLENHLNFLNSICAFPRDLVERLRSFISPWYAVGGSSQGISGAVLASLKRALEDAAAGAEANAGPLAEALADAHARLGGADDRLRRFVAHVDRCVKTYGAENVLCLAGPSHSFVACALACLGNRRGRSCRNTGAA